MSPPSVFKNRRVLLHDFTPTRLPHRERELNELKNYFGPVLTEDVNVKVHVYGSIGSGKTVLCRRLGRYIEEEAVKAGKKLKYVHINLAYTPKPYHVMTKLMDQVSFVESSRSGLSPEEMLAIIAKSLSREDYRLVLIAHGLYNTVTILLNYIQGTAGVGVGTPMFPSGWGTGDIFPIVLAIVWVFFILFPIIKRDSPDSSSKYYYS